MSLLQSCSVSIYSYKSSESTIIRRDAIFVPMVKTESGMCKPLYQTSMEINGSFAFTNNLKGLH